MDTHATFIDSHCHLNLLVKKAFDQPLTPEQIRAAQKYIDQAKAAQVISLINISTTVIESFNSIQLAQAYPNVFATVGIYPTDLTDNWRDDLKTIEKMIHDKEINKIVGIGEVGIDMYRSGYNLQRQIDGFRAQIELALKHDLALVIHTRAAAEETLKVLQEFKGQLQRGVIHCFSYDTAIAREVHALNLHIGISGVVLNPDNTSLHEVVRQTPLEWLLLETDAPFLSKYFPDKKSTPAHVVFVAQHVAHLKNAPLDQVALTTSKNTQYVFSLKP